MSAIELAAQLLAWAKHNGALFVDIPNVEGNPSSLSDFIPTDAGDLEKTADVLQSARLTGILIDEEHSKITILAKNLLGTRKVKPLPTMIGDVAVSYLGHVVAESNPPLPDSIPLAANLHGMPCHRYDNRFACGSSVTAATLPGAGTMGCLVRNQQGELCGLTNNHVTGACNHTEHRMHIMMPAPMDARPNGPAPMAIGRHRDLIPLQSGNPGQVKVQKVDAATFLINDEAQVTSMQGPGLYDTPALVTSPAGGMRVKKVGRTTGETTGTIEGKWATLFPLPYQSPDFNAKVYFDDVWAVKGDNQAPFSDRGDSGSLVVTEDGQYAIGLIFAMAHDVSIIMPIGNVMSEMNLALVSQHGIA